MGNVNKDDFWRSSWKTKRMGEIAYDRNGELVSSRSPLSGYYMRPWFIKASEIRDEIHKEQEANKPWSQERIRTFMPMLQQRTVFPKY